MGHLATFGLGYFIFTIKILDIKVSKVIFWFDVLKFFNTHIVHYSTYKAQETKKQQIQITKKKK